MTPNRSSRGRRARVRRYLPLALCAVALPAALALAGCEIEREAWEKTPLRPGAIERTRLADASGLGVDRIRFYSNSLNEARFFLVLAPKAGPPPQNVLILNHGWWDRPEDLIKSLNVDAVYTRLLNAGAVQRALIVMPDVRFSARFVGTRERMPFPGYLRMVGEEVAGLVSQQYGVSFDRNRWAIGGFSLGGYITLDVARRYPGRFGSASVISSFFDAAWKFWPAAATTKPAVDGDAPLDKQTVVAPGPVPRLFLACGTEDRFIHDMTTLHSRFEAELIQHEWHTAPGGHTWQYWSSVLPAMLEFHLHQARP